MKKKMLILFFCVEFKSYLSLVVLVDDRVLQVLRLIVDRTRMLPVVDKNRNWIK